MLHLLWLLSLPFAAMMLFLPGSLLLKISAFSAASLLGGWGLILFSRQKKQLYALQQAQRECDALKENIQNQQRISGQEVSKLKEIVGSSKKQLEEASKYEQVLNQQPIGLTLPPK